MAIDAERIRVNFKEIRKTAVSAGDGVATETIAASMDQYNVFRHAGFRALEIGDNANKTASMALESAQNNNKAITEQAAEIVTAREENSPLEKPWLKPQRPLIKPTRKPL